MISRSIFSTRENFSFFHSVYYLHICNTSDAYFRHMILQWLEFIFKYHVFIFFFASFRWKNDPEHHAEGVVPPPQDPNAPGELGKPVKFDNPEPEVKALIDEGWKNNAFNQYASDVISLHRSLPDPRDSW